jgi:hypothetical protein
MIKKIKYPLFCLVLILLFAGSCNIYNLPVKDKLDFAFSVYLVYDWEELRTTIATARDGALIALMQNMEATTSTITINTGRTMTIFAFTGEVVISRAFSLGPLFSVESASRLMLGDSRGGTLVLDGKRIPSDSALVTVENGTYLTMNGGSIHGNIYLSGGGGGGVRVGSGGTFTMNDGSIYGNERKYDGGGVNVDGGTFTMNGGSIHDNEAVVDGGGIYLEYGGSTFTMNGGSIYNNEATLSGGGIKTDGMFTMNGGSIYTNTASNEGGGVKMDAGQFVKTGGTVYGQPDALANLVTDSLGTPINSHGHALWNGTSYDSTLPDGTY